MTIANYAGTQEIMELLSEVRDYHVNTYPDRFVDTGVFFLDDDGIAVNWDVFPDGDLDDISADRWGEIPSFQLDITREGVVGYRYGLPLGDSKSHIENWTQLSKFLDEIYRA